MKVYFVIFMAILTCCLESMVSPSYALEASHFVTSDIFSFKRIGQVLPSDDGKQVAFVVFEATATASGKKWEYSLYLKNNQGKIRLLDKSDSIKAVSWSPDNLQIAYLAKGNKYQSIWVKDISNQRKYKLIEFENNIYSFKWSPDGKSIAFTAETNTQKPTQKLAPIDISKESTSIRLYLVNTKVQSLAYGITPDSYSISQFFVYPGYDWSPDSKAIVFSYQSHPGLVFTFQNKIAVINLETKQIKDIPYTENHNSTQPAYSLDGKWIAYQASPDESDIKNTLAKMNIPSPYPLLLAMTKSNHICVSNTKTFETHCLADTFNQNPIMIGWNQSSDNVFVFDPYHETEGPRIYALNINPSVAPKILSSSEGFIEPLTISLNNTHTYFGFGFETVANIPQAFITKSEPFHLEQISDFKNPYQASLGQMKRIQWKSIDGKMIEGLLITPANYDAKKKYPLLVSIHGGPVAAWSKRYVGGSDEYEQMIDPTTCWEDLLNLGFVIFQPNPRGSDGYGLGFRLANFKEFGGADYRDIMSGVDSLIQSGIADPDHLAIAGWSYGGYLSAWSISQTSRFKAAVDGDGNTDWISYEGTSNQPLFTKSYFGNDFWDDDSLYLKRSTVFYTKNIRTPLLILHGENDIGQVPITQSQELYSTLKTQNKDVKMLILPKQGHVPTDIDVIEQGIKEIDLWLRKAL